MRGTFLGAAVTAMMAMILAVSPIRAAHAAAHVQESDSQVTADLNHQSLLAAQSGKPVEATEPKQGKSAAPSSAKAKALRRGYAVRARMAKHKAQLAKSKQRSPKAKKQLAKSKKQPIKAKKKQAA